MGSNAKPSSTKALPLRTLPKKDSRRLPHSRKVQYLYAASVAMSSRNPQYSSYLGHRCVEAMRQCVQPHGLSRAEVSRLCRRCGCAYEEGAGDVVGLSGSAVRRSQRGVAKGTSVRGKRSERGGSGGSGGSGEQGGVVRAGIRVSCGVCGNAGPVWKYPSADVARRVLDNQTKTKTKTKKQDR